jgi:predicted enzyme related to lactoylglutathione lyase
MERVTGIGGVFFKTEDPDKMYEWYEKHLGIKREAEGYVLFKWRHATDSEKPGSTAWSPFKKDTTYFEPSKAPFMLNYRVADLDALLAALKEEGVWIDEKRENAEYGRFAWIMDPEGNRIELWEPPPGY